MKRSEVRKPKSEARRGSRKGRGSVGARPAVGELPLARIIRPEAMPRWLLPGLSAMTPTYIEATLRGAIAGNHLNQWELFDLMEDTWPRLVKNLNELKRGVQRLDWKLQAWAEEEEAPSAMAEEKARLVSRAIWGMRPAADQDETGFRGMIYDLLDAWAKGISVVETQWEVRQDGDGSSMAAPRCLSWVHPMNYAWNEEGWLGLTDTGQGRGFSQGQAVERFPEDKFLVAVCKARSGHALAGALLRPLAWWWCASNFSADWLLNYAQIFGLPIRWASYVPGSEQRTIDSICEMLEQMGSAGWAAFPAGTQLELKEATKGGNEMPQATVLDRADKQCDLLILGQTLTSEVRDTGGALATAKVHEGVREDIILAAAEFVAEVINQQLVTSILRLNYGEDSEAPEFLPEEKRVEDAKANAERDQILIGAGFELPKAWAYKRHGVPLPQEGEEVIKKSEVANPEIRSPNGGSPKSEVRSPNPEETEGEEGRRGNNGEGHRGIRGIREQGGEMRAKDATGKVIDAALEELTGVEARWLGGVKPFFARLVRLAQDERVTDADFVKALEGASREMPELFGKMDAKAVQVALEAAMGAACVNGAVKGAMRKGIKDKG